MARQGFVLLKLSALDKFYCIVVIHNPIHTVVHMEERVCIELFSGFCCYWVLSLFDSVGRKAFSSGAEELQHILYTCVYAYVLYA